MNISPAPPETLADAITEKSVPPIAVMGAPTFYRCEAGWNWQPAPLADFDLWIVLDGRGTLFLDAREVALSEGSGFVFAPGAKLRATQDEAHRLRVFACHFELETVPQAWRKTREFTLHDREWFEETALRASHTFARGGEANERHAQHLVEVLLWHIAASDDQSPRARASQDDVARIVASIREAPGERWLVGPMSRDAKLSPSQFTRKFTELTGASPAHFVITTRLARAKKLLRETDMTVSAISSALGYHDVHFFCRQFKLFTGTTPGSLRK